MREAFSHLCSDVSMLGKYIDPTGVPSLEVALIDESRYTYATP